MSGSDRTARRRWAGLRLCLGQPNSLARRAVVKAVQAPLRLRGRVLEEGRLLYSADEPGRVTFEVRTRSEYFDFLPTQRAYRDHFLRRVAVQGLDG